MSHNAFDPHGEPTRSAPRPSESSSWRAFNSGGSRVTEAAAPRHRPRNPYGSGEPGGAWNGQLMDAPPTAEVPSLWPPVPEPSPPRLGAGIRPYAESNTAESPAVRPGTRFREPSTAEHMTVGRRPPSPYREYATGETPTVSPHSPPPRQRRPAEPDRRSFREPASGEHPNAFHTSPPSSAPPAHPSPPRSYSAPPSYPSAPRSGPPSYPSDRFDTSYPSPPRDRFAPPRPTATTVTEPQPFREPPTAEAATVHPGSAPPSHTSPPRPHSAPPAPDRFGPYQPPTAATTAIDRPTYREPSTAADTTVHPGSAPPFEQSPPEDHRHPPRFGPPQEHSDAPQLAATTAIPAASGYDSPQRSIQVEPDTGSLDSTRLHRAPADPPWQSRKAAEEDASFISAGRVLATVGIIVVIIGVAAAVIWGLNLYGDKF